MYKQPNYEKLSLFLSKENPEEYDFKCEGNNYTKRKKIIKRIIDRHLLYKFDGIKIFMWFNKKDKEPCVYVVYDNHVYIFYINNPNISSFNEFVYKDKIIDLILEDKKVLNILWKSKTTLKSNLDELDNPIKNQKLILERVKVKQRERSISRNRLKECWISECNQFSLVVFRYIECDVVLKKRNDNGYIKFDLSKEISDLIHLLQSVINKSKVLDDSVFYIDESELNYMYIKRKDGRGWIKLDKKLDMNNLISFLESIAKGKYYF